MGKEQQEKEERQKKSASDLDMLVVSRIRLLMNAYGWDQTKMAEKTGGQVSQSAICKYLNGRFPRQDKLTFLSHAFEIQYHEITNPDIDVVNLSKKRMKEKKTITSIGTFLQKISHVADILLFSNEFKGQPVKRRISPLGGLKISARLYLSTSRCFDAQRQHPHSNCSQK